MPVSINHLAEEEDISSIFLEQIFFRLRKAGIVSSVRGPGGGFCFAKPLSALTVKDVLVAAGEDLELTDCDKRSPGCRRKSNCPSHSVWEEMTEMVNKYFDNITLDMVLKRETAGRKALAGGTA
jgi:Rrf2 family iron-sulfur cluster assembly transcriptional regulator